MQLVALATLVLAQTGLQSTDLTKGSGVAAKTGDVVTVEYTGKLKSGKQFDSSVGKAPLAFRLGAETVIKGWDQGIVGMKVGGKRKLVVPPSLGYGSREMGDIPPNSTLVFEVKLLRIDAKGAEQKISYKDLKVGTGPSIKMGSQISVHCRGVFLNGVKFWASYDTNQPLAVKLGETKLIEGFNQGLMGMKKGGKRKVTIPYLLAYGENGRPPAIPGFSTLVFELDVLSVQ